MQSWRQPRKRSSCIERRRPMCWLREHQALNLKSPGSSSRKKKAPANSARRKYPQGITWYSSHVPMEHMGHRASERYTSVIYCEGKCQQRIRLRPHSIWFILLRRIRNIMNPGIRKRLRTLKHKRSDIFLTSAYVFSAGLQSPHSGEMSLKRLCPEQVSQVGPVTT